MADCSKAEVYLKEKGRMTKECTNCRECKFSYYNNVIKEDCTTFEHKHPNKAIEIVQKWSDKHPEKTILQDFMEKYPKALLKSEGIPYFCPHSLGYYSDCCKASCEECWSQPLSEVTDNE